MCLFSLLYCLSKKTSWTINDGYTQARLCFTRKHVAKNLSVNKQIWFTWGGELRKEAEI